MWYIIKIKYHINKKFKEGNIISQKITNSIRFFQELIFDASAELYTIYSIGKLIEESGQSKTYFAIKEFIKYLFNEEEDNMNPVELYKYINENFTSINKDDKEINSLYDKINNKAKIFRIFKLYLFPWRKTRKRIFRRKK